MLLRRTVKKLSSNLSIETPTFSACAALDRMVAAAKAISIRFMRLLHNPRALGGRYYYPAEDSRPGAGNPGRLARTAGFVRPALVSASLDDRHRKAAVTREYRIFIAKFIDLEFLGDTFGFAG